MLWVFIFGLLIERSKVHIASRNPGRVFAIFFFGGLIGAGLLLAVLPFFAFGLPSERHDYMSIAAATLLVLVATISAFGFAEQAS